MVYIALNIGSKTKLEVFLSGAVPILCTLGALLLYHTTNPLIHVLALDVKWKETAAFHNMDILKDLCSLPKSFQEVAEE